ncbi:MAG: YcxB family protein [Clostridia bacterium]|nr:YcxB family protein [Clostridia bacterium]
MEIKNTTIYTKEKMIGFARYHAKQRSMTTLIILLAGSVICFIGGGLILGFGGGSPTLIFLLVLLLILDILLPLLNFVFVPNSTVKKSKIIGATVEYVFKKDEFTMHSKNEHMDQESTIQYTMLLRVEEYKNHLYLYIQPNQAFLVDISSFERNECILLRGLLNKNVKKLKWNIVA